MWPHVQYGLIFNADHTNADVLFSRDKPRSTWPELPKSLEPHDLQVENPEYVYPNVPLVRPDIVDAIDVGNGLPQQTTINCSIRLKCSKIEGPLATTCHPFTLPLTYIRPTYSCGQCYPVCGRSRPSFDEMVEI